MGLILRGGLLVEIVIRCTATYVNSNQEVAGTAKPARPRMCRRLMLRPTDEAVLQPRLKGRCAVIAGDSTAERSMVTRIFHPCYVTCDCVQQQPHCRCPHIYPTPGAPAITCLNLLTIPLYTQNATALGSCSSLPYRDQYTVLPIPSPTKTRGKRHERAATAADRYNR